MQFVRPTLLTFVLIIVGLTACSPALQPTDIAPTFYEIMPLPDTAVPTPAEDVMVTQSPSETPLPATTDSVTANSQDVLLSIYSHGGLCVSGGECQRTVTLYADGTYAVDGKSFTSGQGMLDAQQVASVRELIAQTDFNAIRSQPFTGTCPTAYDGQEQVYTFVQSSGAQEVIASCTYAVDLALPLFQWVTQWMNSLS